MSLSLSDIRGKVRFLIDDSSTGMIPGDIFTYSTSAIFTLTESYIGTVSTVLQNDVELETSEWSYSSITNKVTISKSLTTGDTIEIRYSYFPNYGNTEIDNYIQGALVHISACNYYNWIVESSTIYPEPTDREENLIIMVAATLIEPNNKSYRLPDVMIGVPNDLPTYDKVRKIISIFKQNSHGFFNVL